MGLQPEGRRGASEAIVDASELLKLQWGSSPKAGEERVMAGLTLLAKGQLQWGSSPKAGEETVAIAAADTKGRKLQWASSPKAGEESSRAFAPVAICSLQWGSSPKAGEEGRSGGVGHQDHHASMGLQPEGRRGGDTARDAATSSSRLQWGSSPKAGEEGPLRRERAPAAQGGFNGAPARRPERSGRRAGPEGDHAQASMGLQPEGRRGERPPAPSHPPRRPASMGLQPEGRRGAGAGSGADLAQDAARASMGLQPEGRRGATPSWGSPAA